MSTDNQHRYFDEAGPYTDRMATLKIALLGAVIAADATLAKDTFARVTLDAAAIAWALAAAAAVTATFLALEAGKHHRSGHPAWRIAFIVPWAILGMAMAALRIAEPMLEGEELPVQDIMIAAFVLIVYVGAGLELMSVSYGLYNPKRRQWRSAQTAVRHIDRRLGRLEGIYTRVSKALADVSGRRDAIDGELEAVLAEARHGAEELKALARLEVAARVGRAEATSLYREPTWPDEEQT